jgi:hypothetical protein
MEIVYMAANPRKLENTHFFFLSFPRRIFHSSHDRMPLSQEKVQEWVAEFMKATSGGGGGTPTDWKKLQDLMSKRVTVREASENPPTFG